MIVILLLTFFATFCGLLGFLLGWHLGDRPGEPAGVVHLYHRNSIRAYRAVPVPPGSVISVRGYQVVGRTGPHPHPASDAFGRFDGAD